MLFNSFEFALFLPVVFLLYWFVFNRSLRAQNLFVVGASYLFYGWWDWRFLMLIAFTSLCSYASGLLIERFRGKPLGSIVSVGNILLNLGILGIFKYYDFFVASFAELFHIAAYDNLLLRIILPVGISFYTFQALSYSIDVHRGKLAPTRDVVAFFAFISFFPQLVAGPIERATNLLPQFLRPRTFDTAQAVDGLRQALWGFFKKIVVADNCAILANGIFDNYETLSGGALVIGAVAFSFQIYGDFSGYSDIAIGISRLFGFSLMRNFNYPYFSRDIAEFWRRWHISLTTWFRDYVYIPLGGSRGSKWTVFRNTLVIFLVSGFWHGANWTFLAWGLFYFVLLVLEKYGHLGRGWPVWAKWLFTFLMVNFAWVLFRADSLAAAGQYLQAMFGLGAGGWDELTALYLRENWTVLAASVLFAGPLAPRLRDWAAKKDSPLLDAGYAVLAAAVFLVSAAFLIKGTYNPFIYFNF